MKIKIDGKLNVQPLLTGKISFHPGLPDENYLFRGDRISGHIYDLLNFNEEAFYNGIADPFLFVGIWKDSGLLLCGQDNDKMNAKSASRCNMPIYRGGSQEVPKDSPPAVILHMDHSIKNVKYFACHKFNKLNIIYFSFFYLD